MTDMRRQKVLGLIITIIGNNNTVHVVHVMKVWTSRYLWKLVTCSAKVNVTSSVQVVTVIIAVDIITATIARVIMVRKGLLHHATTAVSGIGRRSARIGLIKANSPNSNVGKGSIITCRLLIVKVTRRRLSTRHPVLTAQIASKI